MSLLSKLYAPLWPSKRSDWPELKKNICWRARKALWPSRTFRGWPRRCMAGHEGFLDVRVLQHLIWPWNSEQNLCYKIQRKKCFFLCCNTAKEGQRGTLYLIWVFRAGQGFFRAGHGPFWPAKGPSWPTKGPPWPAKGPSWPDYEPFINIICPIMAVQTLRLAWIKKIFAGRPGRPYGRPEPFLTGHEGCMAGQEGFLDVRVLQHLIWPWNSEQNLCY